MFFFIFAYAYIPVKSLIVSFRPILIALYLKMKNINCLHKISFALATEMCYNVCIETERKIGFGCFSRDAPQKKTENKNK